MKKIYVIILTTLSIFFIGCNNSNENNSNPETSSTIPALSYSIVNSFPHDTAHFTEGLEFYNNTLLESTGNYGSSKLVQMDPATGKVLKQVILDPKYFGEGITVLHDTLYQMTYKEGVVFVYNAKDFKKIKELPLTGEGWGLTNDGKQLIQSNGSSNLFFYEPGSFKLLQTLPVIQNGAPVVNINELEYINGYVYANQWMYPYILKIDPKNGNVVARIDFSDLINKLQLNYPLLDKDSSVFNGIAYNPKTDKIYVTGKDWPTLFEVQFDH